MKASIFYRIAAVVLVLFALLHTLGFRQNIPGATAVIDLMRSVHINAQGFYRSYWDFFSAFGLYFSVFLLFSAVLAWQLSSLPPETMSAMRGVAWTLAITFWVVTVLTFIYAFTAPLVFAVVATLSLTAAAWLSSK